MSRDKRSGSGDYRGIVISRDLDEERPRRSMGRAQEADSKRKRRSGGRSTDDRDSDNRFAPASEDRGDTENNLDQHSASHFAQSDNFITQQPSLVASPFASHAMQRAQTHGLACTCVTCANQRREKLNEILADESMPSRFTRVQWEDAARQATRPALWTILGIAIAIFILPLIPGPAPGWIDSAHHFISRSSVGAPAQPSFGVEQSVIGLSTLALDAENTVRAYIETLNAYDSDGIANHVTERFRKSAEDQVFIANSLGTQVIVESVAAAKPCSEAACRVNVTARIGGNQLIGADGVTITLAYLVVKVNGVALVDDVLN